LKLIALTQEKSAIVDDEDYDFLNQWKWYAHFETWAWYATRVYKKKRIYMHRVIMKATSKQYCDHVNGNGLDNRRINLRLCTSSQNAANSKKSRNTTSQYKGVCWHKQIKRWVAYIQEDFLGSFKDEVEAAKEYDRVARQRFGEFAKTNFPLEVS
jgi:hypothetical protein